MSKNPNLVAPNAGQVARLSPGKLVLASGNPINNEKGSAGLLLSIYPMTHYRYGRGRRKAKFGPRQRTTLFDLRHLRIFRRPSSNHRLFGGVQIHQILHGDRADNLHIVV